MARCLRREKAGGGLDVAQHRERDGADGVVAGDRGPAGARSDVQGDRVVALLDGRDLGAEPDVLPELVVEGGRQPVHAALDLLHVLERPPDDLAELLDDRGVHVGLAEAHDAVELDGPFGEAALTQEARGWSSGRTRRRCGRARSRPPGVALVDLLGGGAPQVFVGAAAFVLGQLEGDDLRVGVELADRHADALDVGQRLGIAHHERPQLQPEPARSRRGSGRARAGCAWRRPRRTGRARSRAG